MRRAAALRARGVESGRTAPCSLLEWDSRHFGFPIGQVAGQTLTPQSAEAVDDWCVDQGIRCLYLLADADDAETAEVAASRGYREVDVRVTARRSMEGLAELPLRGPETMEIRDAGERELDQLLVLAGRSHHGSRFYADGAFPRERCDALYRAWVERGFRDPERGLLVAVADGEPAGYSVFSPVVEGEGHGELVAVHERYQGQGIGWALHVTMFRRLVERGSVTHRGVLSGHNVPIVRLHERLGFTMERVQVWHHKWYGGSRAGRRAG
jgi:dTDP-4-amino-4,6-dideoxy-D-galactose acyltransferase